MTTKRRITASELLTLADTICKLSGESGHISQYGAVTEKLNSALVIVLEAGCTMASSRAPCPPPSLRMMWRRWLLSTL